MTASGPQRPGATTDPGSPDPLSMSVAEKLACEWEARHDVVARGGRLTDPAAVAHYLSHARCEDQRHAVDHEPHVHPREAPDAFERARQRLLQSWLRWGEDGR